MRVITVVGSGGKTAVIRKYEEECRNTGLKVLVTTTTHMYAEGDPLCLSGELSEIRRLLLERGSCTAGLPLKEENSTFQGQDTGNCEATEKKFGPLPEAVYREACRLADVVLVEGDGSRGLPVKYPAAREPVIPENTTEIWVVTGMWALGRTLGEACHRSKEAEACLNAWAETTDSENNIPIDGNTVITPVLMNRLLEKGYLRPLSKKYPSLPVRVLAGQKDTLYRKAAGALLEQRAPEQRLVLLRPEWFREQPRLVLCGAGHVSAALYEIAVLLEFRITVLDDREEFADPARFPKAESVLCVDFSRLGAFLPREGDCYYAILTRGHQWDQACVEAVLQKPEGYAYLGMIGSRGKVQKTREALRRRGYAEEQLSGICAPIGLPLGGQTPAEIAVSIAAQLVQVRNSGRTEPPISALPENLRRLGEQRELHGVLAIITGKTGSAPRGEGSMLFLGEDGSLTGTVGGGNLEFQATQDMGELLRAGRGNGSCVGKSICREYDISEAGVPKLGMICGGKVEVLLLLL